MRITARDIHGNDSRFDRAEVVLRDVHVRSATAPVRSAAPQWQVETTSSRLERLLVQLRSG